MLEEANSRNGADTPLLVLIMLVANNPKIMGHQFNGLALNLLGWAATIAMGAASLAFFLTAWR